MADGTTTQRDLDLDRLPTRASSLEVRLVEGVSLGSATERGPRAPHRHDYHEVFWVRRGSGAHRIDGEEVPIRPGTVTVVGRGRVHQILTAEDLHGAVVQFGGELLHGGPGVGPAWLVGMTASPVVDAPAGDHNRLDGLLRELADELHRPPDARSIDLQRHFLSALLLWIERWYEDAHVERHDADRADVDLYRRFLDLLEQDFARHTDAVHYADALGVPQGALSKTLVEVTGRSTKEHVTDRRMLAAARLLRFTTMAVGEIAYRAGYADQLYFSRAFRRHYGVSPTDYRHGGGDPQAG